MSDLAPLGLMIGLAMGLAVLAVTLTGLASERASARAVLREIDDLYDLRNVGDDDPLLLPLANRLLAPLRGVLVRGGRLVSPGDYVERVRVMLSCGGVGDANAVDRFIARRLLCFLGAPVFFFAAYATLPLSGMLRLVAAGIPAIYVALLPKTRLDRTINEREGRIRKQLPSVLDLLVVCVEAGLGFSSALARTVASVPGELADEFAVALGELRAGASRSEALGRLADRVQLPEIRSFVNAMRQADELGVSIAPVLRTQSDDMRVRRRQLAQEKAQKAPVKMLVPMVFCIFPPLFIVVIGPAGLQMAYGGGL